jgi:sugar lactone lactonase YvrE
VSSFTTRASSFTTRASSFTTRAAKASAIAMLIGLTIAAPAARADHTEFTITLPGATSAEGIASGAGSTFYAGDLFSGDIYRGDIQRGTAEKFIDNPPGRNALGLRVDVPDGLLFVAGGFDGRGYVYDLNTGATLATYQFSTAPSVINDVAVTPTGAWFTNSLQPELYFVPITDGHPGAFSTLHLTGPAAEVVAGFNNNGIQATADGSTLLVAHTNQGAVNAVDPASGASRTVEGVSVPNVDGILLEGRSLYAVQNFSNQITEVQLSGDLGSGSVTKVVTSSLFEVPTTVARFGDRLATVNAKFDTGFPPTATSFEVVVVDR